MMPDKKEVIKHSAAVHIQNNITLLQRRSWNVLLANAYDELPTEEEHHIAVKDLARMLDFDSKNDNYLKEALEALVGCKVKWNVLDKDGEEEWGVTTLLARAKIRRGICTYAYSPELRRRLHNPRMYARINLGMQNKFESSKQHARKAAEDLREAAGAVAGEYRGKAEQVWNDARGKAEKAWTDARGRAEEAWGDARTRARTFQDDAEQYVRENPTKAIFTALGVGFVLGLIFRR